MSLGVFFFTVFYSFHTANKKLGWNMVVLAGFSSRVSQEQKTASTPDVDINGWPIYISGGVFPTSTNIVVLDMEICAHSDFFCDL